MSENKLLFERILGLDDAWNTGTYESVNRWTKAVRRRGDRYSTKLAYLKWMSYFLRFINLTADEDAELGRRLTLPERREERACLFRNWPKMVFIRLYDLGVALGFVSILDFFGDFVLLEHTINGQSGIKTIFDHFRNTHAR